MIYSFEQVVREKDGFLRGPFGSALKKSLFVPKSEDTIKVYEQSVPLEQDETLGRYYISRKYFNESMSRFEAKANDFLISCSGVNYGAIYQLSNNAERGVINQALLRVRLNNDVIDDNYFLYLFKSLIMKKITTGTGDSTIPNFPSMDVVKKIEFELPELSKQKRIGYILDSLDRKITSNIKINTMLEKMTKILFDYWFLQFDFPDIEGKPYKSSGGKLIWNDEFKSEIPQGWEIRKIRDVLIEANKSKIQVKEAKEKGKYPFFTSGDSILSLDEFFVDDFNIFLNTGGNPDIKAYKGKCAYSTDTWCISAKQNSYILYYYLLKLMPQFDQLFFAGSGLKHLQKDALKNKFILIPDARVLNMFNHFCVSNWEKISNLTAQNQELSSLRDFLLPLLMNGQVTF